MWSVNHCWLFILFQMCVWVCVCMSMCGNVCTCVKDKGQHRMSCFIALHDIVLNSLSLNLQLIVSPGWLSSMLLGPICLWVPVLEDYKHVFMCSAFIGARNPNSGPCACEADTSLTELIVPAQFQLYITRQLFQEERKRDFCLYLVENQANSLQWAK